MTHIEIQEKHLFLTIISNAIWHAQKKTTSKLFINSNKVGADAFTWDRSFRYIGLLILHFTRQSSTLIRINAPSSERSQSV